ncbi:YwaF family protein [Marinococcus halophilus]|uniref:YwaF family protein n=1 Tax=Marinococcus halophilus TaxID=1371 RepID=UPI0009A80C68|nr:TIGR02206 family membrane protein [Marinococcus halophilus]
MWWWNFNHDGPAFESFGIDQLMVWLCLALACFSIILFQKYLRRSPLASQTIKWLIVFIFLLGQLSLQLFYITNGIWDPRFSLPLKVSDLAWIAVVIMLITGSRFWTAFAFYAGTSSALLTIVFPDIERYGFPHFRFLHFFITHALIVVGVAYQVVVRRVFISFRSLFAVWGALNIAAALVFLVNLYFGGNYMYLMEKPASPSPYDFFGPWPYYLLTLQAIALAAFVCLYAAYRFILKKFLLF